MGKRVPVLLFSAVVSLLIVSESAGCGDKYLSVGRGSRFQRGYVSVRPVSIAVVRHQTTTEKQFLSRLKMAGHRVEIITDVSALPTRLESGKFDVVLAGYSDGAAVNASLQQLPLRPLFLPVVEAGSPHTAAAHRQYGCLLNGSVKSKENDFLAVLDAAVESNRKAKPVQCELKKM